MVGDPEGKATPEKISGVMRESEEKLEQATRASANAMADAMALTREALETRRTYCHPLSLLRYHAESACFQLAMQLGEAPTARACCRNVLAFYEMALSHVPWHPMISLERFQLAELEMKLGDCRTAHALLGKAANALVVTHGDGHIFVQRCDNQLQALSEVS